MRQALVENSTLRKIKLNEMFWDEDEQTQKLICHEFLKPILDMNKSLNEFHCNYYLGKHVSDFLEALLKILEYHDSYRNNSRYSRI